METHFRASANVFLIYFIDISASDSFFLLSWKGSFETNPSFWLVEMLFLVYFLDISARGSFFLVSGNVVLN